MPLYRVYYNREQDWPQVWSVDEGGQETEINVLGIKVEGGAFQSRVMPKEAMGDRMVSPAAWFEVVSERSMVVERGWAIFR